MRCVIVHLQSRAGDRNEIMAMPMGLLSIAGYLDKRGHRARIVHAGLSRERAADERALDGAGALLLDLHWTRQARPVVEFAQRAKRKFAHVPVVVGGFTASYFSREILAGVPEIDAVVRGDGEVPAAVLLDAIERGESDWSEVPNLAWRRRGRVVENSRTFSVSDGFAGGLDHACFELFPAYPEYLERCIYADFDTSTREGQAHRYSRAFFYNPGRGCPGRCSFCGASFWTHKMLDCQSGFFFYPLAKAARDLAKARAFGAETWRVSFDPSPRREYYRELFARVRREGLRYRLVFDCFLLPTASFVDVVERTFSPDSVLVISAECGSERVRRRNRSFFFANDTLVERVRLIRGRGLGAHVFFSAGLPFERASDIAATEALIRRIREIPGAGVTVCPMDLDPGSPMFEDPARFGVRASIRRFAGYCRADFGSGAPHYRTRALSARSIAAAVERLRKVAEHEA
jgi:radical SAM superfamily enzyme YgiQ (UPF0313 family)